MPEDAEPQQPQTTVPDEDTAPYAQGEGMDASKPPYRAMVKDKKVAASVSSSIACVAHCPLLNSMKGTFSPGDKVWLNTGIYNPMVVGVSGWDKEKKRSQYQLTYPDGQPYTDETWVEQGKLTKR
ncbi:hypothetical protein LTR85_007814 [Meristemomyces frigidus]|nr:hypothetical protein LTR85_007814 [Meristemomyces frigidus]